MMWYLNTYWIYPVAILIGYVLGSVPTGLWIGIVFYKKDIRKFGSGNIGATNAFRVLGKIPGIISLAIDVLKGFIPVLLAKLILVNYPYLPLMVGISAIFGHLFSIFLLFKGGKGVATGTGVYLALAPIPTLIAGIVFLVMAFSTRMVSVGSITSAIALAILVSIIHSNDVIFVIITLSIAILVIYKHRSNIQRIIRGEENKF
ncbi:MAG TPA: glycerol-3-phosphate 1-O-acyltransferase PlsY [Candidatus Hydrogenedens sp.]|nr:glycerol-3-phosphate 1-O-acyltransferase PlsY [Candidatus Hydrogenedens sp.]HPP58294.1 glycerol-3-phosphate 1-O-acyltransferase PlsY [Candidatus Hydrogenedens sp.]